MKFKCPLFLVFLNEDIIWILIFKVYLSDYVKFVILETWENKRHVKTKGLQY